MRFQQGSSFVALSLHNDAACNQDAINFMCSWEKSMGHDFVSVVHLDMYMPCKVKLIDSGLSSAALLSKSVCHVNCTTRPAGCVEPVPQCVLVPATGSVVIVLYDKGCTWAYLMQAVNSEMWMQLCWHSHAQTISRDCTPHGFGRRRHTTNGRSIDPLCYLQVAQEVPLDGWSSCLTSAQFACKEHLHLHMHQHLVRMDNLLIVGVN